MDFWGYEMSGVVTTILLLGLIVWVLWSLCQGLIALLRPNPSDKACLVRALTVRIVVSLLIFVLLMVAWAFGLWLPHRLM